MIKYPLCFYMHHTYGSSNEREVCQQVYTMYKTSHWGNDVLIRTACGWSRAIRTGRLPPRPALPVLTARSTPTYKQTALVLYAPGYKRGFSSIGWIFIDARW